MRPFKVLFLLCLALLGCADVKASAELRIIACWKGSSRQGTHILIKSLDFLYLRGQTILAPSVTCEGLRIQGMRFSHSAIREINNLAFRNFSAPLGFNGSVLIDAVKQPNDSVIEVDVLHIFNSSELGKDQSLRLLDQIYPK